MKHMQTAEYAGSLLKAMGAKAELHAQRQVEKFELADDVESVHLWQQIRAAIIHRKASAH